MVLTVTLHVDRPEREVGSVMPPRPSGQVLLLPVGSSRDCLPCCRRCLLLARREILICRDVFAPWLAWKMITRKSFPAVRFTRSRFLGVSKQLTLSGSSSVWTVMVCVLLESTWLFDFVFRGFPVRIGLHELDCSPGVPLAKANCLFWKTFAFAYVCRMVEPDGPVSYCGTCDDLHGFSRSCS